MRATGTIALSGDNPTEIGRHIPRKPSYRLNRHGAKQPLLVSATALDSPEGELKIARLFSLHRTDASGRSGARPSFAGRFGHESDRPRE
jgi:hypothetical protein